MEKIEVYFVGGGHGSVSLEELKEMIAVEIRKGYEPTVEFYPDGSFIFNFYEVVKITDA